MGGVVGNCTKHSHQNVAASPARKWRRQAAASCYFHLGLPKLVQPLRSQYELSISSGAARRVYWTRRKEPLARILYYHRVNDDRDPFFPAISSELFEQEMDYLRKHYKVVGLLDLLDRLESGSPETMVAVTFEEGYQENYLN